MEVDTIIGEAAYSGKDNLQLTKEQSNDIIAKLSLAVSQGCRKEGESFHYNKGAGVFVCSAGHLSNKKRLGEKKERNE